MKNNDKDDNLGNDSSFLTRWSKRKSESNEVSSKSEQNEKNTVDVKDESIEEENKLSQMMSLLKNMKSQILKK